jgi:cytochrome c-type biogenesis protein CcmH
VSVAILTLAVLAAVAFAAWPAWRRTTGRSRLLLAAALSLFVIGLGAGTYLMLGRPALALREDAIAAQVRHLRAAPGDLDGWKRLGDDYLKAGADTDAAKAYLRAIEIARATGRARAGLYSDFGAALVGRSDTVPAEAQDAFRFALALNPKDPVALYFMGFAAASQGRAAEAVALWQVLLDESPADAPYRKELAARIASLKAQGAPDIPAMVAKLASRLKAQPNDGEGWQRLVRSYVVLGDVVKARTALADARKAMAANPQALKALAAEAQELGLEK